MAKGVDLLGKQWAESNSLPVNEFPADWNKLGKSAGHARNLKMAENADALLAIWDGFSKGTQDMINIAMKRGLPVFIYSTNTENKKGEINDVT